MLHQVHFTFSTLARWLLKMFFFDMICGNVVSVYQQAQQVRWLCADIRMFALYIEELNPCSLHGLILIEINAKWANS